MRSGTFRNHPRRHSDPSPRSTSTCHPAASLLSCWAASSCVAAECGFFFFEDRVLAPLLQPKLHKKKKEHAEDQMASHAKRSPAKMCRRCKENGVKREPFSTANPSHVKRERTAKKLWIEFFRCKLFRRERERLIAHCRDESAKHFGPMFKVAELVETGAGGRKQDRFARRGMFPAPSKCRGKVRHSATGKAGRELHQSGLQLAADKPKACRAGRSLHNLAQQRGKVGPLVLAAQQEPDATRAGGQGRERGFGRGRFRIVDEQPAADFAQTLA